MTQSKSREIYLDAIANSPSDCELVYDELRRMLIWKNSYGEVCPIADIDNIQLGRYFAHFNFQRVGTYLELENGSRRYFLGDATGTAIMVTALGDLNRLEENENKVDTAGELRRLRKQLKKIGSERHTLLTPTSKHFKSRMNPDNEGEWVPWEAIAEIIEGGEQ